MRILRKLLTVLLVELIPLEQAGEMGNWALVGRGAGLFVMQLSIGLAFGFLLGRLRLPGGIYPLGSAFTAACGALPWGAAAARTASSSTSTACRNTATSRSALVGKYE